MNKKYLIFGLPLLAIALVAAGIGYYALATVSLTINQPISVTGDGPQTESCDAGKICLGDLITISNSDNSNKIVTVTNDNTNVDVDVGYVGKLRLVNKDLTSWDEEPLDGQATIYYTVLDNTFSWRYKSSSVIDRNDYTLIYYMDDDSNVDTADRLLTLGSGDETITTKLPLWADWNRDANPNYCLNANGFDSYAHCYGAKLWLVPTDAITGSTVDWSKASEFLFETDLIWYSDSETNLTVPANSFIEFYPQFTVDEHATSGSNTINITVA